jgi:hypothetical protein
MPLFLKSVSSYRYIPRFFFHTLFLVVRVLKHSSNFLLIPPPTPLPFNFQSLHSFTMMKRSHSERENGFPVPFFKHIRILEKIFLILESYFLCHIPLTLSLSARKTMTALTTVWLFAFKVLFRR